MKANHFKQFLIKSRKKISFTTLTALFVVTYYSCFPPPYNENYSSGFDIRDDDVCLAVMNFDYNGHGLSAKLALKAADNITADLFIKKRVNVVDRNLVRNILAEDENVKRDKFSRDDVKRIGTALKASHIIFGSLYSSGSVEDFYKSEKYQVDLTLRIVDVVTGEVVGVIKRSLADANLEILLDKLVIKVVNSM